MERVGWGLGEGGGNWDKRDAGCNSNAMAILVHMGFRNMALKMGILCGDGWDCLGIRDSDPIGGVSERDILYA